MKRSYVFITTSLFAIFTETASGNSANGGFRIGRMYHCLPTAGEVWYLRRLPTKISSPKRLRLWSKCFREAVTFALGSHVRPLFVVALIWGPLAVL